jgi:hypothetical protein
VSAGVRSPVEGDALAAIAKSPAFERRVKPILFPVQDCGKRGCPLTR